MSEPMPLTRIGMPERRMLPVVTVGPYVLLALLTAATVAIKHSAVGSLRIDLILCGLAAAWIAWMFTLHPAWRVRPRPMAVFFVVFVVTPPTTRPGGVGTSRPPPGWPGRA